MAEPNHHQVHPLSNRVPAESERSAARNPYQYLPLDEGRNEIRLLTIYPDEETSSQVRMNLSTESFTVPSDLQFKALSYAWGSTDDPVEIVMGSGSETISVTRNLAQALPFLRQKTTPVTIWIDAICVNQQDLGERSRQVRRMTDIYSSASQVLVWLGLESSSTSLAIEVMRVASSNMNFDWDMMCFVDDPDPLDPYSWSDPKVPLPWTEEHTVATCELLKRDWFGRLWIWQEFHLAQDVVALCGSNAFPFDYIRDTVFAINYKRLNSWLLRHLGQVDSAKLLFLCKSRKTWDLLSLLRDSNKSLCSDPRDRIYAMLSLVPEAIQKLQIEVDYTKSVEEVYTAFTRKFIDQTEHLNILTGVENNDITLANRTSPSWVPDWSSASQVYDLPKAFASGSSQAQISFQENGVIHVSGAEFGYVKSVGIFGEINTPQEMRSELKRLLALLDLNSMDVVALSRVLLVGIHADAYFPPRLGHPVLGDMENYLEMLLLDKQSKLERSENDISATVFMKILHTYCTGRSIFKFSDRAIGIGPMAIAPGDKVVALLGCDSLMCLRPTKNGRYLVLGESYCSRGMSGELFLGHLPAHFDYGQNYSEEDGVYVSGFVDRRTSEFQLEDPRLRGVRVPPNWMRFPHRGSQIFFKDGAQYGTLKDPRMSAEELEKRGVALEVFELE